MTGAESGAEAGAAPEAAPGAGSAPEAEGVEPVRIGIIGGGQLGRLLALNAGTRYETHVLCPDAYGPAAQVCDQHIEAEFDDREALEELAQRCDVITYEFENVSAQTLRSLTSSTPVRPNIDALVISQDRFEEKTFLQKLGVPTAAFAPIDTLEELELKAVELGGEVLIKTRRFGYDGKGQLRYSTTEPSSAERTAGLLELFADNGADALIVEALVDFDVEISVIGARSLSGEIVCYEPALNEHKDGILRRSKVPCGLEKHVIDQAKSVTAKILEALDYVGVIGVEFFVDGDDLLVNEFAPRVHNSGHWTEAACDLNQFEMHLDAVSGAELRQPKLLFDCEMFNLIGDEISRAEKLSSDPKNHVTTYAKKEVREGRKMGHYTRRL